MKHLSIEPKSNTFNWEECPQYWINGSTQEEQFGLLTIVPWLKPKWEAIGNGIERLQSKLTLEVDPKINRLNVEANNTVIGYISFNKNTNASDMIEVVAQAFSQSYARFNLKASSKVLSELDDFFSEAV